LNLYDNAWDVERSHGSASDPEAGVVGAIAGDAPPAGRDARFEAFFRASDGIDYGDISG
jgi:hypothetical protein